MNTHSIKAIKHLFTFFFFTYCQLQQIRLFIISILGLNVDGLKCSSAPTSDVQLYMQHQPGSVFYLIRIKKTLRMHSALPHMRFYQTGNMRVDSKFLNISKLCDDFMINLCQRHFNKIVVDSSHSLLNRVVFNESWKSSNNHTSSNPKRTKPSRANFFSLF